MEESHNNTSKIAILILVVVLIAIFFYLKNQKEGSWTLMVCKTLMDNGVECFDNSYEIPGFASAKECLLEGATKFSKEGFECGRNCRQSEYSVKVCSEICNKAGCRE